MMSNKMNESQMIAAASEINLISDKLNEIIISFINENSQEIFGYPIAREKDGSIIPPTRPNMDVIDELFNAMNI